MLIGAVICCTGSRSLMTIKPPAMLSALMNDPNVSFLHVSNTCYSISKAMPKVAPSSVYWGEKETFKRCLYKSMWI